MNYNIENEVWKDVKGYEGYYQVSNTGKVKALGRYVRNKNSDVVRFFKEKELKIMLNGYGYPIVNLSKNNSHKKYSVHALVANAFLQEAIEGFQVNHKDGIKTNNKIDNLEFVSAKDNIRHAHKIGLVKKYGKKLTEKQVVEIRKKYAQNEETTHQSLADEYGVSDVSISKLLSNKSWARLPHYSTFK